MTEGGYEAENFFPALGKKGKWLFFTAAPLKNEDGEVTGAIETLQDITERKKAEEAHRQSERRLRTLLDFVPERGMGGWNISPNTDEVGIHTV